MPLVRITQIHADLRSLAQKNAQQHADPTTLTIFNTILTRAKLDHPSDDILADLPEATGQVSVGDLLVRAGQLKSALEANTPPLMAGS